MKSAGPCKREQFAMRNSSQAATRELFSNIQTQFTNGVDPLFYLTQTNSKNSEKSKWVTRHQIRRKEARRKARDPLVSRCLSIKT